MLPEYVRRDSDFVYIYPEDANTFTYQDAVKYCVDNYGAGLPTIHSRKEAQNMGLRSIEESSKFP